MSAIRALARCGINRCNQGRAPKPIDRDDRDLEGKVRMKRPESWTRSSPELAGNERVLGRHAEACCALDKVPSYIT